MEVSAVATGYTEQNWEEKWEKNLDSFARSSFLFLVPSSIECYVCKKKVWIREGQLEMAMKLINEDLSNGMEIIVIVCLT